MLNFLNTFAPNEVKRNMEDGKIIVATYIKGISSDFSKHLDKKMRCD